MVSSSARRHDPSHLGVSSFWLIDSRCLEPRSRLGGSVTSWRIEGVGLRVERFVALAGLIFVAAIVGTIVTGASGPDVSKSAASVAAKVAFQRTDVLTDSVCWIAAGVAFLCFAAGLSTLLTRRDAGQLASRVVLVSGAAGAATSFLTAVLMATVASSIHQLHDSATVYVLFGGAGQQRHRLGRSFRRDDRRLRARSPATRITQPPRGRSRTPRRRSLLRWWLRFHHTHGRTAQPRRADRRRPRPSLRARPKRAPPPHRSPRDAREITPSWPHQLDQLDMNRSGCLETICWQLRVNSRARVVAQPAQAVSRR